MLKSNLLATKLYPPSLPAKWVQRPHLIQRLNEGLEFNRRITLVSAPPGFGKTTCISEWVNTLDYPVVWLSLAPLDDDPGRFFTCFVVALQMVNANLGREIEGVLRSGQLPPADVINAILVNDILEFEGHFLLVLDDFHVIQDRFILQVLEQLVTNLPQPLHLILIANLSGSHRFILSYLTEQVLSRQPEGIRQFLLQTSILDRLNGDLCNAVKRGLRQRGESWGKRRGRRVPIEAPTKREGWTRYRRLRFGYGLITIKA